MNPEVRSEEVSSDGPAPIPAKEEWGKVNGAVGCERGGAIGSEKVR